MQRALPRHHRARGVAHPRRRRVGRVEPVLGVRRRRGRGLAALRRGGGRGQLARPRSATPCRSTCTVPVVAPERGAPDRRDLRLPHRQGQGRRPRQHARRRRGPGRGGARRARPLRPGPGGRQRRLGRRRPRSRRSGGWTARPATSSTSSSRAPRSRTWPAVRRPVDVPIAADESIRRGDRPLSRPRPRGRRHRGAQGAAPRRRARPACGSPRRSGCRSWCPRRWRPRSASPPGVALAAALPELPYACGLATRALLTDDVVDDSLVPVDGALPVRRPDGLGGRPRPAGRVSRTGAALAGPAGRGLGLAGSALVSDPSTELAPRAGHRAARRRASPRSSSRRARAAPLGLRRLRRRVGRPAPAAHAARRAVGGLPGPRPDQGRRAGGRGLHLRDGGGQPAPGDAGGGARRRADGRGDRRPAGAPARYRRQPDHRPGGHLRPAA